jgi:hypothetical protein
MSSANGLRPDSSQVTSVAGSKKLYGSHFVASRCSFCFVMLPPMVGYLGSWRGKAGCGGEPVLVLVRVAVRGVSLSL